MGLTESQYKEIKKNYVFIDRNRYLFAEKFKKSPEILKETLQPITLVGDNINGYSALILGFDMVEKKYEYPVYYTKAEIDKEALKIKKGEVGIRIEIKNKAVVVFNVSQLLGKMHFVVYRSKKNLELKNNVYNSIDSSFLDHKLKQFFLHQFFNCDFTSPFIKQQVLRGMYKNCLIKKCNDILNDINSYIKSNGIVFEMEEIAIHYQKVDASATEVEKNMPVENKIESKQELQNVSNLQDLKTIVNELLEDGNLQEEDQDKLMKVLILLDEDTTDYNNDNEEEYDDEGEEF